MALDASDLLAREVVERATELLVSGHAPLQVALHPLMRRSRCQGDKIRLICAFEA